MSRQSRLSLDALLGDSFAGAGAPAAAAAAPQTVAVDFQPLGAEMRQAPAAAQQAAVQPQQQGEEPATPVVHAPQSEMKQQTPYAQAPTPPQAFVSSPVPTEPVDEPLRMSHIAKEAMSEPGSFVGVAPHRDSWQPYETRSYTTRSTLSERSVTPRKSLCESPVQQLYDRTQLAQLSPQESTLRGDADASVYDDAIRVSMARGEGEPESRFVSKRTVRQVEVPYTRRVKVPIQTERVVPTMTTKQIETSRVVEREVFEEIEEEYVDIEEREVVRDKVVWEKQIVPETYKVQEKVVRKRMVQVPTTELKEVTEFVDVTVPSERVVKEEGFRVDTVVDRKVVELEEVQPYEFVAIPVGPPQVVRETELAKEVGEVTTKVHTMHIQQQQQHQQQHIQQQHIQQHQIVQELGSRTTSIVKGPTFIGQPVVKSSRIISRSVSPNTRMERVEHIGTSASQDRQQQRRVVGYFGAESTTGSKTTTTTTTTTTDRLFGSETHSQTVGAPYPLPARPLSHEFPEPSHVEIRAVTPPPMPTVVGPPVPLPPAPSSDPGPIPRHQPMIAPQPAGTLLRPTARTEYVGSPGLLLRVPNLGYTPSTPPM